MIALFVEGLSLTLVIAWTRAHPFFHTPLLGEILPIGLKYLSSDDLLQFR